MCADHTLQIRAEFLLRIWSKGALSALPIIICDSKPLLDALLLGLGGDVYSPMVWETCGQLDPLAAHIEAFFSSAAGWRLRRYVSDRIGKRWRWRHPCRTETFGRNVGSAGRVDIPLERLWMARGDGLPEALKGRYLTPFGDTCTFFLDNDGMIAIDVSRVQVSAEVDFAALTHVLVERLLRHPGIWGVMGNGEGKFHLYVSGDVSDLMDSVRTLKVSWKKKKKWQPWTARVEA